MAAPIPDTNTAAREQPELTHTLQDGNESATQKFKGGVGAIQTLSASYAIGSTTGSRLASSAPSAPSSETRYSMVETISLRSSSI